MKFRWYLIGLLVAIGCGKSATESQTQSGTHQPEPRKASVAKTDSTPEPTPLVANNNETRNAIEPTAPTQDTLSSEPEQPAPEAGLDDLAPLEPGVREKGYRLLLPTSTAPLIVDVEIQINGQPLQQAFDQELDKVLQNAAGDSDNRSWRKLFEHVAGNPIRFGNSSNVSRGQYRQMTQRYDRNHNGEPDRDEAARYLFQASPHSSAFRMYGTDFFRGSNRSKSAIFTALDSNRDHVLDGSEIATAGRSLQALDQNADDRIDVNEILDDTTDLADVWKRSRSKRWGEVAMDLTGQVDWSMLSYMIGNLEHPGPFGQTQPLLSAIDRDNDQSVDADEAKQLLQVSPDLRLLISYHKGGEAEIEVQELSHELRSLAKTIESPRQVGIVGSSFSLVAQVMRPMTYANQFPDQAFAMFDVNHDGGLDETEIPEPALREYSFAEIDSDQDGKLTIQELRAGFAAKEPIWSVQVRARGAESQDAFFAWFDQNQDRFLSAREIQSASALLESLASDHGTLKPSNIPDTYLIQFGRGDPSQDAQLFSAAAPESNLDDSRPRWAVAMDANRDGDISADEFTGTREQFRQLDKNDDQFVDFLETGTE